MPTVKIYVKGLNKQQKQELISLLEEAGYTVIVLEEDLELEEDAELEAPAVAPDGEEPSDEVLIVLITPASEAPDFKKAVTKAARRGHRVIGIWPKMKRPAACRLSLRTTAAVSFLGIWSSCDKRYGNRNRNGKRLRGHRVLNQLRNDTAADGGFPRSQLHRRS